MIIRSEWNVVSSMEELRVFINMCTDMNREKENLENMCGI